MMLFRFNDCLLLTHKLQSRTMRSSHTNTYYVQALQKHCQDFSQHLKVQFGFIIGNKQYKVVYISVDYKELIIIGEPGKEIYVMGRQALSLVP